MKTRADIINNAKSLIGYTNYTMGAKWYNYNNNPNKPKLLDCSGFVVWCYKMAGFSVPDGTYHQWQGSTEISKDQLQIGDIGIKEQGGLGMYNHVGIYAGDGMWIHCNYSRNGVTIEKTNMFKYFRRFNNIIFEEDKTVQNAKTDIKNTIESEKRDFIVNGKKMQLDTILLNSRNYVSLQSLKEAGVINATYDSINKIAIINSK